LVPLAGNGGEVVVRELAPLLLDLTLELLPVSLDLVPIHNMPPLGWGERAAVRPGTTSAGRHTPASSLLASWKTGRWPQYRLDLFHFPAAAVEVGGGVIALAIGGHLDLHPAALAAEPVPFLGPRNGAFLRARLSHTFRHFVHGFASL